MSQFSIKKGDTSPKIEVQLQDEDREPRNLQTASKVRFVMEHASDDEIVVDEVATIKDAADGVVYYQWSAGDTDKVGYHRAEFEVTYDSGDVETFPNNGYIDIDVDEDIA